MQTKHIFQTYPKIAATSCVCLFMFTFLLRKGEERSDLPIFPDIKRHKPHIYTKTFKRVSIQRPLEAVTIERPLIFSVCMKLESRTLGFIMVYHYLLGRVPTNEPLEV